MKLKIIIKKIIKSYVGKRDKRKYGGFGQESTIRLPRGIYSHKESIYIGNNTTILKNSRMQIYSELTGIPAKIRIGNNCHIGERCSILAGEDITIGDGVLIASDVLVTSENHGINPEISTYYMDQLLTCKKVFIDEGCWIGEKVTILPGVHIGKKCVVAAGCVVTKDVPDFSIVAGVPGRIIKKYNFATHKWDNMS